jgi:uncharacterized protein with NRDE domain
VCLILFAWQAHPRYRLVVAANRDEFHARPTTPAAFWPDRPDLLAGRDLQAGGTWLGLTRTGRFAAITNYREPQAPESATEHSRGHLVSRFLDTTQSPLSHARELQKGAMAYHGFNLLLADRNDLVYVSNRNRGPASVSAGVHGLSNHLLDTAWPKVDRGRARLETLLAAGQLDPESLLEMLTDHTLLPGDMPHGIDNSLAPELLAKHYFIVSEIYGTRSSTVLLVSRDGEVEFVERSFDSQGRATGTQRHGFGVNGD